MEWLSIGRGIWYYLIVDKIIIVELRSVPAVLVCNNLRGHMKYGNSSVAAKLRKSELVYIMLF